MCGMVNFQQMLAAMVIHLANKCLLSTFYIPGTVVGVRDAVVNSAITEITFSIKKNGER